MAANNGYPLAADDKFTAAEQVDYSVATHTRSSAPAFIQALSPQERQYLEAKLRRKIDTRLLPMAVLMYIMNYLDRNNIASARLGGLETDLKLVKNQYQTCVSILFVGYLLMQIPSNLLLNKLGKPAIYLPTCMVVWGIVSGSTAGCHNFSGLLAVRFFLGFVEAAYFPGCLFWLSSWYTRKELALRTAILYSGALISGAFSGLIAAGIVGNMDGAKGLRAWRWLFIIEGAITVVIACISYFILPNFPRTTSWLTEEERELAAWRLQEDIGEDDWSGSKQQTFFHGFKQAALDIKTWILMIMITGIVSAGGVTNFFPTVVQTLKYNRVQTLLLTAPPYVLAVITTYANAWHADKTAPRYVAMMLMVPGCYTAYVVCLAWISNCMPRPPAKRAAALAMINAVSNCSSIYVSYMYPNNASPRFYLAFGVNIGTLALAILMATILRLDLMRLNRKLNRGEHVEGAINAVPGAAAEHGFRFLL